MQLEISCMYSIHLKSIKKFKKLKIKFKFWQKLFWQDLIKVKDRVRFSDFRISFYDNLEKCWSLSRQSWGQQQTFALPMGFEAMLPIMTTKCQLNKNSLNQISNATLVRIKSALLFQIKMGHSRPLFYFVFSIQLTVNNCSI